MESQLSSHSHDSVLSQRSKGAHVSKYGLAYNGQPKTGTGPKRNQKCPCGSGLKYKKCCLGLDEGWLHDTQKTLVKRLPVEQPKAPQSFDVGAVIGGETKKEEGVKLGEEIIT